VTELRIIPLEGIPEVRFGDDLGALLGAAAERVGDL
jgi:F420-0:gamma-glutamyl ligase